jgi:hypothetical protein
MLSLASPGCAKSKRSDFRIHRTSQIRDTLEMLDTGSHQNTYIVSHESGWSKGPQNKLNVISSPCPPAPTHSAGSLHDFRFGIFDTSTWLSTGFRLRDHRITRSALAKTLGGMVNPICLAAFRLMMNSNFVGCSTGRSPGLAPLRILSTKVAARRYKSAMSAL